MKIIEKFLNLWNTTHSKPHIAVAGDVVLDEYYQVTVDRISPEFPIPVMLSSDKKPSYTNAGGAANVCSQINLVGGIARILCIEDDKYNYGHTLGSGYNRKAQVPIKRRLYKGHHHLFRWDIEKPNYNLTKEKLTAIQCELIECYSNTAFRIDGIIFSDYNKGFFSGGLGVKPWFEVGRKCLKIVDPKSGNLEDWIGCDIFKPNFKEAQAFTGSSDPQEQCEIIHRKLGCEVVITLEGKGFVGINENGSFFEYKNSKPIDVINVIGAGDCFTAFLALAKLLGMSTEESAELAFHAGTIYVQKGISQPIEMLDIRLAVNKVVSLEDFLFEGFGYNDFLNKKEILVMTNGVFDLLHPGHVQNLKKAKAMGNKLLVAVNSDESVKKLKGPERPIMNQIQRAAMVAALDCVDFVIVFNEETPYNIIERIKPDILVKGQESFESGSIVGSDIVDKVEMIPMVPEVSTSKIIEKIRKGIS